MLTAVVITKNEQANIAACLHSLQFAPYRLVLDGGSQDDTCEIARALGCEVAVRSDWQGFGIQKQRAVALARTEWVLVIDADERVSDELSTEIMQAITHKDGPQAYRLKRVTPFYGLSVNHGGFETEQGSVRLFNKNLFTFDDALVHEKVDLLGAQAGVLKHALIHHSFEDPDAYLRKMMSYSKLQAQQLFLRGKKANAWTALTHSFSAFLKSYFVKGGFLDGQAGLWVAVMAAEMTYHKYFQLWLLSRSISNQSHSSSN